MLGSLDTRLVITLLLKAGAEEKAKGNEGQSAFDYTQGNEKLKSTDVQKRPTSTD
jgi:hypothetical protein